MVGLKRRLRLLRKRQHPRKRKPLNRKVVNPRLLKKIKLRLLPLLPRNRLLKKIMSQFPVTKNQLQRRKLMQLRLIVVMSPHLLHQGLNPVPTTKGTQDPGRLSPVLLERPKRRPRQCLVVKVVRCRCPVVKVE